MSVSTITRQCLLAMATLGYCLVGALSLVAQKAKLPITLDSGKPDQVTSPMILGRSLAYCPDGKTLASGSLGTIKLWNVSTGKVKATLKGTADSMAFSPDSNTLAAVGGFPPGGSGGVGRIKLFDVKSFKEHIALVVPDGAYAVVFSPDGKTVACGCQNGIALMDVKARKMRLFLSGHRGVVKSVAFSKDGKMLASTDTRTIKLWVVETDPDCPWRATTIEGNKELVYSLAFSLDGKTLAAGGDRTIVLWEVNTTKKQATLMGHKHLVFSLAYSPDGNTLASGNGDRTIKLWDVNTRKERATLRGHKERVCSVAFSPDGKTLASNSSDGTVKLWDVSPELK